MASTTFPPRLPAHPRSPRNKHVWEGWTSKGTDVLQCGGPAHLEVEFIGPGGHWGEVASLLRLVVRGEIEDVADEIHLGDCGYYFLS